MSKQRHYLTVISWHSTLGLLWNQYHDPIVRFQWSLCNKITPVAKEEIWFDVGFHLANALENLDSYGEI